MKLEEICRKVACDLLSKPGTLVELMDDRPYFGGKPIYAKIGDVFKVTSGRHGFLNIDNFGYMVFPTRFRKLDP